MKKFSIILISIIMILASVSAVFADDLYIIDPITGEITGSETGYGVTTVRFSSNCTYSKQTGLFSYTIFGNETGIVESNIYDGMIVSEPVYIKPATPSLIEIYRDGDLVGLDEYENLSAPGKYMVRDLTNNKQLMSFTIVSHLTGSLYLYAVPTVFDIYGVVYEGRNVPHATNVVDFSEEGEYRVEYGAATTGKTYTLEVQVDHTPPELTIYGVNEQGIARDIVTIGETEKGSTMVITRDGDPIEYGIKGLKQQGEYMIAYTDSAGNTSTYYFRIQMFLDASAWWFVVLFVFVAAIAIGYMIYSRKHMRVR